MLRTREVKRVQFRSVHHITAATYCSDLHLFAVASADSYVKLYTANFKLVSSLRIGAEQVRPARNLGRISAMVFSVDPGCFFPLTTPSCPQINALVWVAAKRELVAVGNGTVRVWTFGRSNRVRGRNTLESVTQRLTITAEDADLGFDGAMLGMHSIRFSGCAVNARHGILYVFFDRSLVVFNAATGAFFKALRGIHRQLITGLLTVGHSQSLVTSSLDGTIKIWTTSHQLVHIFDNHTAGVTAVVQVRGFGERGGVVLAVAA